MRPTNNRGDPHLPELTARAKSRTTAPRVPRLQARPGASCPISLLFPFPTRSHLCHSLCHQPVTCRPHPSTSSPVPWVKSCDGRFQRKQHSSTECGCPRQTAGGEPAGWQHPPRDPPSLQPHPPSLTCEGPTVPRETRWPQQLWSHWGKPEKSHLITQEGFSSPEQKPQTSASQNPVQRSRGVWVWVQTCWLHPQRIPLERRQQELHFPPAPQVTQEPVPKALPPPAPGEGAVG